MRKWVEILESAQITLAAALRLDRDRTTIRVSKDARVEALPAIRRETFHARLHAEDERVRGNSAVRPSTRPVG